MCSAESRQLPRLPPVHTVALDHQDYPPLLRQIDDPPSLLHVRGDPSLLCFPQVAIVGSRKASPAGLQAAGALAQELVNCGIAVCSGLAQGIDGAGHRSALAAGGKSIAVLGTGIDKVYPRQHRELAWELAGKGCLVTEFPPGTPPRKSNFPRRNRIISGLSLGVLVVEAALPSGSLITASTALQQGREVFALPWSMQHRGGRGCLQLIRDGAKIVTGVDDILEELEPLVRLQRELSPGVREAEKVPALSRELSAVMEMVGYEATSLDLLARVSGLPMDLLMVRITALELEGLVQRCPGGYIRC